MVVVEDMFRQMTLLVYIAASLSQTSHQADHHHQLYQDQRSVRPFTRQTFTGRILRGLYLDKLQIK